MSRSKRSILFVSQSFFPAIGGVSSFLLNLIQGLAPRDYIFHAIHFDVSSGKKYTATTSLPVKEYCIHPQTFPSSTLKAYATFKETIYRHLHGLEDFSYLDVKDVPGYSGYIAVVAHFAQLMQDVIRRHAIEIVNVQDYQLAPCLTRTTAAIRVLSLHTPILPSISPVVLRWLTKELHEGDHVIFSIPAYARTARKKELVQPQFHTIPPIGRYDHCKRETWKHKKLITITCIQRFDAKSGHLQLIRAFARVCERFSEARLLLVGGDSFTNSISKIRHDFYREAVRLVDNLGISKYVTFTKAVNYLELCRVYQQTDILCLLSRMECFGLTVTDGMSHRLPIVVTNVGGLRYQVKNNWNGYVVDVDDIQATARALARLLASTEQRHKLGMRGRKRFETYFAPQLLLDRYDRLYRSL